MKNLIFALGLIVLSSIAFAPHAQAADAPVAADFGAPFANLALAQNAIAPLLPNAKLDMMSSIPSDFGAPCNPIGWQYIFANMSPGVTAFVKVQEVPTMGDVVDGQIQTKCVPVAHFTISDTFLANDAMNDLANYSTALIPLAQAQTAAVQSGLEQVQQASIQVRAGPDYPNFEQPFYTFYGLDAQGKPCSRQINALSGIVVEQIH